MADESEQIKNLYEYSATLDAAGADAAKHLDVYKGLLVGAKGGPKAKSLSAQLIPRYFKYFPDLLDEGINALTDLCEEEDMKIRILAVRAFPGICKDTPSALPKAADILGQLLQTEIQVEQDNVKHSLIALLRIDAKAVIRALFNQILNRDESQREKAILFLKDKLFGLKDEILTPHEDVERELAENIKKALADVTGEEFKVFMDLLGGLKIYKGENSKELLEILADQADLKSDFKPTEPDNLERLLSCMHLALPFLQKGTASAGYGFLNYLASKVLPALNELSQDQQNRLLQALAELSPFSSGDEARLLIQPVYSLLQAHVPNDAKGDDAPKLNFSAIESLLFTLHHLGVKAPGAVSSLCGIAAVYTGQPSDMVSVENAAEKMKQFKERLEFLARKSETYVKELNDVLKHLSPEKEKDKHTTASTAIRTTRNILEMVKPLLNKQKPLFLGKQLSLKLSWQKDVKRKAPEPKMGGVANNGATNNGVKKPRGGFQGVYTPPAKREEGLVSTRGSGGRGIGGGRGRNNRGNFRGRGSRGKF